MTTQKLDVQMPLTGSGVTGLRVTFIVTFLTFLAVAVLAQVVGLDWRSWFAGAEGKSLFGGVKTAVYTLLAHVE
ncbi:MAG: hypothetical protein AB8C46_11495 [Burkholderiaceae bacterium]